MAAQFESCKLFGLGSQLYAVSGPRGGTSYEPSKETIRRATEMGKAYATYPDRISLLVCSGYYPKLANPMPAPPPHINEANMMRHHLIHAWQVPPEKIAAEGKSVHTFDNFAQSIRQGYLRPGEFDPQHPLVLSVSRSHSWRVGMIAAKALLLPPDSVFRLQSGPEDEALIHRERDLAILTKLAIGATITEPGSADYVDDVAAVFMDMYKKRDTLLVPFKEEHGYDWLPEDIPVLAYAA
jgi:hypothetical protein